MKIAFVVGEHSSDRLGAELIRSLRRRTGSAVEAVGLGGDAMGAEGLRTLFDIDELSIIGVGAVLARFPQLVRRLSQTAGFIADEKPDALVVIDSYAFSHRVARRARARLPTLPIVNYVPPAVWAYHGSRAAKMTAYIDRVVSIFPFEPDVYAELQGPPATYVGHPVMREPGLLRILSEPVRSASRPPTLLLLPGSRRAEVERLFDAFVRTLSLLARRIEGLRCVMPTVPRLEGMLREKVSKLDIRPEIVVGDDAKWDAFHNADAALAASGTVALELALAGVPMALCYKLDPVTYPLRHLISGWTAALPNYIADHPLVPEHFHEFVRPELLARRLFRLLSDTPERRAQVEGLALVRERMTVAENPGDRAAEVVLDAIAARRR